MPQSLSLVVVHVIFSTKDRFSFLESSIRPELNSFLAGVARKRDCECYRVGGVADHIHLAIRLSRTITIADLIMDLKTSSSKWLMLRSGAPSKFAWQRGYGCFSVGPTDIEALCNYIDNQETHHRKQTFQDEFRMFLKKYRVEYDEA
jgi:putative transposase